MRLYRGWQRRHATFVLCAPSLFSAGTQRGGSAHQSGISKRVFSRYQIWGVVLVWLDLFGICLAMTMAMIMIIRLVNYSDPGSGHMFP